MQLPVATFLYPTSCSEIFISSFACWTVTFRHSSLHHSRNKITIQRREGWKKRKKNKMSDDEEYEYEYDDDAMEEDNFEYTDEEEEANDAEVALGTCFRKKGKKRNYSSHSLNSFSVPT